MFKRLLFGVLLMIGSSPIVLGADSQLLERLGVTPTQLKSKDFTLPFIKGGQGKLSDYRGKWVLLNFWATWCGPCRQEMPTLESVAQEFNGEDLQVLGVSVDQGPVGLVRKYLKEQGISFPNFHDNKSEVSSVYQATAIPSVYIISPDGYLAGVFRGGKSWETKEVLQTLKELVAFKSLKDLYGGKLAKKNDSFSFPKDLLPPVMKIKKLRTGVKVGEKIRLSLEIKWPGDSRRYLIKVPRLKVPKGIELQNISSSTGQKGSHAFLEYHYQLLLKEPGTYRLGPVELAYSPRGGGAERFSRHPGVDLELKKGQGWILWVSILVGTLVVSLLLFFRKKSKKVQKVEEAWVNEELLADLKKMKMEGKQRDYVQKLIEFNKKLSLELGKDGKEEEDLLQMHKYGGSQIDELKMRFLEKRLEENIGKEQH